MSLGGRPAVPATAWVLLGLLAAAGGRTPAAAEEPPGLPQPLVREEIRATVLAVADWQLAHPTERTARAGGRPQSVDNRSWVRAVFFLGVLAAHRATEEARYLEAAEALAEANRWRPGRRREHADDHCISQLYLELHRHSPSAARIAPTRELFDRLLGQRRRRPLWGWADALFMSPPAAALLFAETGDRRYLDWLTSSWRWTESELYDRRERLWYRDPQAVGAASSAAGAGPFWGRGNGWVLAGAARVLEQMGADEPHRPRFERLLREMAGRLVELQGDDGLWRSDLLTADAAAPPEASASALITYGLALGVRQGVLDADRFRPAVARSWDGLEGLIETSGRVGWVQPVGRQPAPAAAGDSAEFGAGAVLLAGEQLLALAPR